VRAYATNSAGTSYGSQVSFTTSAGTGTPPTVTTTSITSITSSSAIGGGNVTDQGSSTVTARGVCWSTSQSPTTSNSKTVDGTGTGSFTSSITGLTPSTPYYVRAYATNSAGTSYGSQVSFTTSAGTGTPPTVTTTSITSITSSSAIGGGNVTDQGSSTVTARGVCWSTSQSPTTSNSKTVDGTGTGSFTSAITGLNPSTPYYVRAYATNNAGTSYGSQVSFTTSGSGGNVPPPPILSFPEDGATNVVNPVNFIWAPSNEATSYTLQVSTNPSFTNLIYYQSGLIETFVQVSGLSNSTPYYWRVNATNNFGTSGWSNTWSFITTAPVIGWYTQAIIDDNLYWDIEVINDQIVIVAGESSTLPGTGIIYKTTDGGLTWKLKYNYQFIIHGLKFVNTLVGWAVTNTGILKTIDGGETWNIQVANPGGQLYGLEFLDEQIGWVVGLHKILKTTNSGSTWTEQFNDNSIVFTNVKFIDAQYGFVVGYDGRIMKSTNGGLIWNQLNSATTSLLFGLEMIDVNLIWVTGDNGTVKKSTDGGITWNLVSIGNSERLRNILFADSQTGWIVGTNKTILKTNDAGASWYPQISDISSYSSFNSISMFNHQIGWISGGYFGGVLKTITGGD
jgi:photosystem II stability/assembly factor-like uncharacterized protein